MTILQSEALIESKSLRSEALRKSSLVDLESVLTAAKVHSLFQALWKGEGWATTKQLADYYEIEEDAVWQAVKRHKDEFTTAGYITPKRSEIPSDILFEFTDKLSVFSEGRLPALFNPRAAVLLGMLLRDSAIAKGVRAALLQIAENYPTLSLEINHLREENQQLRSAIAALHELYKSQQQQIQSLRPLNSNTSPPGWDAGTWNSLPPQDKRYFRSLYRRRRFQPSNQEDEPLALPVTTTEETKQQQRDEVSRL